MELTRRDVVAGAVATVAAQAMPSVAVAKVELPYGIPSEIACIDDGINDAMRSGWIEDAAQWLAPRLAQVSADEFKT